MAGEEYLFIGSMFLNIGFFIFFVVLTISIAELIKKRKTKEYREQISDLYVAGRIRQLADKDKIDLDKEYIHYKKWISKRVVAEKMLDNAIEHQLKNRLMEESMKGGKPDGKPSTQ